MHCPSGCATGQTWCRARIIRIFSVYDVVGDQERAVSNVRKRPNVCLNIFADKWPAVAELARTAERVGASDIGIADTPLITRDMYVSCVACLQETSALRVHTAVTNPVTRHPSVTAGSALSLCERRIGSSLGSPPATAHCGEWGSNPQKLPRCASTSSR